MGAAIGWDEERLWEAIRCPLFDCCCRREKAGYRLTKEGVEALAGVPERAPKWEAERQAAEAARAERDERRRVEREARRLEREQRKREEREARRKEKERQAGIAAFAAQQVAQAFLDLFRWLAPDPVVYEPTTRAKPPRKKKARPGEQTPCLPIEEFVG